MARIDKIQKDAAQMTDIKNQLELKGKEQTDTKLKIGLYAHKFNELELTIEKTIVLL